MTIKEYMKAGRVEGDASTLKRVACVDIAFINRKGERDETQLTVTHHLLTEAGRKSCRNFSHRWLQNLTLVKLRSCILVLLHLQIRKKNYMN